VAPTAVLRSTLLAEDEVARFSARGGLSAFVGPPDAYQPLVWDEDAAAALVTAAAEGVRGVFDVADDEPLTRARLAHVLEGVVGRRVRRRPTWLVRAALGPRMEFLLRSQRVSHRRFTGITGWVPEVPSATEGLPRVALGQSRSSSSARARSGG
jgi:nucleoside-diphosphate-sugar epimerase